MVVVLVPGDVAKGFGAGADFVMLGGMLAGHKEGGGNIIEKMEKNLLNFMDQVLKKQMKSIMVVFLIIDLLKVKKLKIPLKSSLDKTIRDILGGVRSSCTYVGAPSLKQLSKCTTFVRVNNQYNDTFGKI